MGKAIDLSAIEKSKIITMRESDSSYRVISKSVGRSVTAVKNVLDCFQKEKKFLFQAVKLGARTNLKFPKKHLDICIYYQKEVGIKLCQY
jgi:hypothetical protein